MRANVLVINCHATAEGKTHRSIGSHQLLQSVSVLCVYVVDLHRDDYILCGEVLVVPQKNTISGNHQFNSREPKLTTTAEKKNKPKQKNQNV